MSQTLNQRMKEYENITRFYLPKNSYIIGRIDGRAFHTWTKGLIKPFDEGLIEDMNDTAKYLCENIMGAKFAYVQSDEISILLTDFDKITSEAWFGNNIQKMASVAASMATAKFNQLRLSRLARLNKFYTGDNPDRLIKVFEVLHYDDIKSYKLAEFDARFWQMPSITEVKNYMISRQRDATKNSIASVAQSLYSHKELMGKNSNQQQELIFQKGINWNDYPTRLKRGGLIKRVTFVDGQDITTIPNQEIPLGAVVRNKWIEVECPIFSNDVNFF